MRSKNLSERLSDPNFNISEWIERQNKALAEYLFKEYRRVIRKE